MSILLVLAAALCGGFAGYLAGQRIGRGRPGKGVVAALVLLAASAAVATNATRFLLDLGLSFATVDFLEAAGYFVFGFSIVAAWAVLAPSRVRWFLAALVPVAMFEPLRWALILAALSLKRLGW